MVAKSSSPTTPAPEPKFHHNQTSFKIGAPPVAQSLVPVADQTLSPRPTNMPPLQHQAR